MGCAPGAYQHPEFFEKKYRDEIEELAAAFPSKQPCQKPASRGHPRKRINPSVE